MTENSKYCMGCMKEIPVEETVCPYCYYNSETVQHYPCMPKESMLSGRYLVGKAVSMANDSISYMGLDTQTQEIVTIHEFYPVKIVERGEDACEVMVKLGYDAMFRNCLQSFISLWKAIGAVEGELSLPEVRNIIDFNGTVYAICKYIDSITLKSYFEETKKPLSWQKAYSAYKPVLSALSKLHEAGVIHGNITPSSVHVGSDGKLHITSFMIPQCHSQVAELAVPAINGFSPLELFAEEKTCNAASDVYSVMALIYYSITGIVPAKATERAVKDDMIIPSYVASSLSKKVITAFVKGLSVYPENRIATIDELVEIIAPVTQVNPAPAAAAKAPAETKDNKKQKSKESKKKKEKKSKDKSLFGLAIGTFVGVVILCCVVFSVLYTTVLYKNYDIPVLNKAFQSFAFLPMNKENQEDELDGTLPSEYEVQENNYVTVPDFTKYTYDSIVANEAFNENFTFNYTYDYSDEIKENGVIKQDLTKGESVLAGTTVNLVISRGSEQIELPEVIGYKYAKAEKTLTEKGFTVKKELLDNDGSHEEGIVETMSKVAGLEFEKGTEIVLSVWDKAKEKETKKEKTTDKEADNNQADADVAENAEGDE